jgi:citrate synthase
MFTWSAEEAAARLGVKVDTVYAYVSRGVLHSRRAPGSRLSLFDPDEIEVVARRGRPRRTSRPPALDFVIESQLTTIRDHELRYRGRDACRLARRETFEQVAHWLWTGDQCPLGPPWEAASISVPDVPDIRDRLRLAVVLASAGDPLRADLSTPAVVATGRSLLATMVSAIPARGDARSARLLVDGSATPLRGTLAGRLWGRLTTLRPTPGLVAALNAALVITADHELAASTLAARVAASTRADPFAVVLAGMGPLSGALHGGASRVVYEFLESASNLGPDAALAKSLENYRRYPGFGHPLYPDGDPRARLLLDMIRAASPQSPALAVADAVIAAVRRRARVEPTIDVALAVLAHVARMPVDAGEGIFTIARTAGWLAHALEEYAEGPLRFRARAVSRAPTGNLPGMSQTPERLPVIL